MDVARRFAKQGYVAIAPDLVSRGGTPAMSLSTDERRAAYAALNAAQSAEDARAALELLKGLPSVDSSKLAATGYCAGGGITWRLATIAPDLTAAAPFYGSNPPLDAVPNIRAAIFAVYGGLDERVDAGIPDVEAAMQAAGTTYEIKVYPQSLHAFHDDTSPNSYNPDTAREAWIDTLNWFAEYLGLPQPRV
jgi:carboxymethylenebutenolidase